VIEANLSLVPICCGESEIGLFGLVLSLGDLCGDVTELGSAESDARFISGGFRYRRLRVGQAHLGLVPCLSLPVLILLFSLSALLFFYEQFLAVVFSLNFVYESAPSLWSTG
jgi:hypothetical protein